MKLVLIEWRDSQSVEGAEWLWLETVQRKATPILCCSVGWVVAETKGLKGSTTLVSSISGEEGEGLQTKGNITIVNSTITKLVVLRKK